MKTTDEYREALEDMVWQFAYHGTKNKKPMLHSGGLSALELAFDTLEWNDPHILEDSDGVSCDVENCYEPISGSGCSWRETGYWCCCLEHNKLARQNEPCPIMKKRAIERESRRDKETGILQFPK